LKNQKTFLTVIYFLSFTSLGLITGALGPAIPSFAANTATSLREVSSLFIFSSLGYLAGSFMAGILFHKIPGNRILFIVLIMMGIGIGLIPVIRSLWLLVGLLFIIGIAQSNLDVGENTLLIWLHGSKVAPYMNSLHFFFGLGSFIAPLIIAQSLRMTEMINLSFWVMAALIILPAPFLLRLNSPANPDFVVHPVDSLEKARPKAGKGVIVLLGLFFLFFTGAELTFGNWIYTYSIQAGFTTAETGAYLTSAFWGSFMLGRFLGIGLSRKLTNRQIIWIDVLGGILSLIVILILPNSAIALWVCSIFYGLFIATGFPTGINLAEELNAVSTRITSYLFIASSISGMTSPWIVGQFIESHGPSVLIWVVLANLILAAFVMVGFQMMKGKSSYPAPQPNEILPLSTSTD
jgi:FHS family Na+ dependent glucose MFS transporter 1